MSHINWYAQLIKLQIENKPVTSKEFERITSLAITDVHLLYCISLDLKPQMNQLVQELLALGVSSKTLAEYFHVSKSVISYHKHNPIKSEYRNHYMEVDSLGFAPSVTQINSTRPIRYKKKYRKGEPDYEAHTRRTKEEMQQINTQKANIQRFLENYNV